MVTLPELAATTARSCNLQTPTPPYLEPQTPSYPFTSHPCTPTTRTANTSYTPTPNTPTPLNLEPRTYFKPTRRDLLPMVTLPELAVTTAPSCTALPVPIFTCTLWCEKVCV